MSGALERVEAALQQAGSERSKGGAWRCPVPAHGKGRGDRNPSLGVDARDGRVLICCRAGCSLDDVLDAIGLGRDDLRDDGSRRARKSNGRATVRSRIVATYDYRDVNGNLAYQVVRKEPKAFLQRRPDGAGGWIWGLGGVRPVLYQLSEVIAAVAAGDPVWIVEGEKDVESLRELDQVATTAPMGAGKWREEFSEVLRGAPDVRIIADDDEPGRRHARDVASSLMEVKANVRLFLPAEGCNDVGEHLERGHQLHDLRIDRLRESYLDVAPTPAELREMAAAPPIIPIATHLLYPEVTTVFAGDTNMGKTTCIARVAVDLVYGREPWTGKHDRDRRPMRLFTASKDDTTRSLVAKIAAQAPDDTWMDGRLVLIGKERHPAILDDRGFEMLGNTIADGHFDVFVIDPFAHFLPQGLTANDDEAARLVTEGCDRIATSLGVSGCVVSHLRKRPANAKSPIEMTKTERMSEVRGSSVLTQLARSVVTLWETEPGRRMLDAVVNDVPPLAEMHFETSKVGDFGIRWEIAGPPIDGELEELRQRALDLEPGSYSISELARQLFEIDSKRVSGTRRTQAKRIARRFSEDHPDRLKVCDQGRRLTVLPNCPEVPLGV